MPHRVKLYKENAASEMQFLLPRKYAPYTGHLVHPFGVYFKFMDTFLQPLHKYTTFTHPLSIHSFVIINQYLTKLLKIMLIS